DDFLKKVDVKKEERDKYYKSLGHNMNALDKRIAKIAKKLGGINVTFIAEKPSVGARIAEVLSNNNFKEDPWYDFPRRIFYGTFRGVKACFRVVATYGHIYK